MRIDEIIPRLFISARTHQLSDSEKLQLVRNHQLTTIVNLWHTPDGVLREAVIRYIHCSISDGRKIPNGLIDLGMQIVDYYNNGERILVHCYGGRNRAALVIGIVVHAITGIAGDDLVLFVQQRRRGALKNPHFVQWLQDYSRGSLNDHQSTGHFGLG